MTISKAEQYELEKTVFILRTEGGLQALRSWAYGRRDTLNAQWFNKSGDDLLQMQGEAQGIARIIKMIDDGPTIKTPEGGK